MANSITGWNTFTPTTGIIRSAHVMANFNALKNGASLWQKFTVGYASFSALGATATGSVVLHSLTASEVMSGWMVKHSTALAGTSITGAVARVGKTGADSQYTEDFNVFAAVSAGAAQLVQGLACEFSSTSLILTCSLTGGLLNQLSQGSIDVYVLKNEIP